MELSERYNEAACLAAQAGKLLVMSMGLVPPNRSLEVEYAKMLDTLAELCFKTLQKSFGEDVKSGKEVPDEMKMLMTMLRKKQKEMTKQTQKINKDVD